MNQSLHAEILSALPHYFLLTKKLFCLRRLTIFTSGAKYAASEKLTFIYDTVYPVFNKLHERQWVEVVALM